MSYPEIIFIRMSNNPSPFLQKWPMLSKSIRNKNAKKCRCTRLSSDSTEGFHLAVDQLKPRYSKGSGHLPKSVKSACSGTCVQKHTNAETDQSFCVTAQQSALAEAPATRPV
jgi:hypothetical protein